VRRDSWVHFAPDGGEGGGEGGTGEGAGTEGAGTEGTTFSQADVDRIVRERLARQKAQYADYDELKTAAERLAEIEAANKSELEKAQERAAKAEAAATEAAERVKRTLTEAAISTAAAGKLADPTDAVALIDRGAIEYGEDGAPTNVAALVDALIEAKPHLAAAGVTTAKPIDQGARGGDTPVGDLMGLSDAEFMKALSDPNQVRALAS